MKKLSKKTLNKSFLSWFYGNLTCFSQEHMQTFGYLCAMLPVVQELYNTKEEQKEALKTYSAFFNTEPQIGTLESELPQVWKKRKQTAKELTVRRSMVSVRV